MCVFICGTHISYWFEDAVEGIDDPKFEILWMKFARFELCFDFINAVERNGSTVFIWTIDDESLVFER